MGSPTTRSTPTAATSPRRSGRCPTSTTARRGRSPSAPRRPTPVHGDLKFARGPSGSLRPSWTLDREARLAAAAPKAPPRPSGADFLPPNPPAPSWIDAEPRPSGLGHAIVSRRLPASIRHSPDRTVRGRSARCGSAAVPDRPPRGPDSLPRGGGPGRPKRDSRAGGADRGRAGGDALARASIPSPRSAETSTALAGRPASQAAGRSHLLATISRA